MFHNHSLHKAVVAALIEDRTYRVNLEGGGEALVADTDIAVIRYVFFYLVIQPEDLHTGSPNRGKKRKLPMSPAKTPLKKRILAGTKICCCSLITTLESAPSPLRTSQNSIPPNSTSNTHNINTNTGNNEPPTSNSVKYVPTKGDLKNAAILLRLLEKKEKLLQELAEMNSQAEKVWKILFFCA